MSTGRPRLPQQSAGATKAPKREMSAWQRERKACQKGVSEVVAVQLEATINGYGDTEGTREMEFKYVYNSTEFQAGIDILPIAAQEASANGLDSGATSGSR